MSHNWCYYNEKLKFSDAKNTRKIDAFFSKLKLSETSELEVDKQYENRPLSFNMMIDFVTQSENGQWHQHPQPKVSLLMLLSLKIAFFLNLPALGPFPTHKTRGP